MGECPNNAELYDVDRHLIFGVADVAVALLQNVRKGKTPIPPPPANEEH